MTLLDTATDVADQPGPSSAAPQAQTPEQIAAAEAFSEVSNAADLAAAVQEQTADFPKTQLPTGDAGLTDAQKHLRDDQRFRYFQERAKRQKQLGRQAFERLTPGAATISKTIVLNNVSVGSSLERFVAVADEALYVVGRRGPSIIGPDQTDLVLSEIMSGISKMEIEAANELAQSEVLLNTARESDITGEFLEPKCVSPAVTITVNARHPGTLKMISALQKFDALIANLTVLEWNGGVDSDRQQIVIARQKKLSSGVFAISLRSLQGLRRKFDAPAANA